MTERVAILRGNTSHFVLPALLRMLSLGRQHMSVELFDAGEPVAAIVVKATRIVGIEPAGPDPLRSFRELLRARRDWDFTVWRLADVPFDQALGTVGELLDSAAVSDAAE